MKKITFTAAVILMAIMGVNAQIQTTWLTSGNSATSHYFLGSTDSSPIKFRTSNTERMCISALGNVGIGTSLPQQMLHVVGGNILISKTSNRAPGSTNGSLLFGDTATTGNPFGEWGIEYENSDTTRSGLNFWRPWNYEPNFRKYPLIASGGCLKAALERRAWSLCAVSRPSEGPF